MAMSIRRVFLSSFALAWGPMRKVDLSIRDHGLSDEQRRRLAELCLSEAAQIRFGELSVARLAQLAEIKLAKVYDGLDRVDLVGFVHDAFDASLADNAADILAQHGRTGDGASARDIIFDLIMRRFEAMEAERAGLSSMLDWANTELSVQPARTAFYFRTARRVLFLAGLAPRATDPRLVPLAWTLARVENAWRHDEYGDFAQTMAVLDGDLHRYERWAKDFDPRKFWDAKFWDGLRGRNRDGSRDRSMAADEPDETDMAPINGSDGNRAYDPEPD